MLKRGARIRASLGNHALDHLRGEAFATAATGAAFGTTPGKPGAKRTSEEVPAAPGDAFTKQPEPYRVVALGFVGELRLDLASLAHGVVDLVGPVAPHSADVAPLLSFGDDLGDALGRSHGLSNSRSRLDFDAFFSAFAVSCKTRAWLTPRIAATSRSE
jgi:hypothetical protein